MKKIFLPFISLLFLNHHGENITKIEASKEDSQEKFYENNKKKFNIKGHLSISSGGINTITLSPLWGMFCSISSSSSYKDFMYDIFSNVCCFQSIFFDTLFYGAIKEKEKEDIKYVFKGIPYSFFCWLFSCSLRYDYFFNKTIGIGAKFDLFGDIIKQHNLPRKKDEDIGEGLLKNQNKKLLEIEKVDHECSYYFNLFQGQIFMNICYNKSGTNNKFFKKYIGGSLGLTLGLGIEDFIFKRKNFYPIFSFQITPVVIFKPNGFFFSFSCFNLFLNRWPYLKYFFKNKKLPSSFSDTNICTFVYEYILLNCIIMSLKFNFGYSWTLGSKKVKVEEEL